MGRLVCSSLYQETFISDILRYGLKLYSVTYIRTDGRTDVRTEGQTDVKSEIVI